MKKHTILVITILMSLNLFSQSEKYLLVNKSLKDMENTKSGNFSDAFSGFYQFAFKSIAVNEKSLDLNSTLFSLVKNYDEDILTTKSRKNIVFLRNFQVNAKLKLNDKLNFNGYSAGITYALCNKRDKSFINLNGTTLENHLNKLAPLIAQTNSIVIESEMKDYKNNNHNDMSESESQQLAHQLSTIGTAILNLKKVDPTLKTLYDKFIKELDEKVSSSPYFTEVLKDEKANGAIKTDKLITFLQKLKSDYLKEIENKPFVSISSEAITDKNGKLNQASFGSVFLAGSHFGEFDVRVKYNYADTLNPSMPRENLNTKLGYNFKIIRGKEEKIYFEIKAYGEYNRILKNKLPDEKNEIILANVDFRIRLSDELWFPITAKYDKTNHNFLGLFNITYNFEGNKNNK